MLEVIAGYDPKDELTAFSIGRMPAEPYRSFANERTLNGMRIGVIREHMDKKVFNEADVQAIDLTERAIGDLRRIGATIVDPGPGGALFQVCIDKYFPLYRNRVFIEQNPNLFPSDANGKPTTDRVSQLVDMYFDPKLVPPGTTIRNIGAASNNALTKYMLNRYLRERGDANIKSMRDLIDKSKYYRDIRPEAGFIDRKAALEEINSSMTLDLTTVFQDRFASRSCCNAWQNRPSTLSCLRRGTFRLIFWARRSSPHWTAERIPSGASWANTVFRHCRRLRVSPRRCMTACAIRRRAMVQDWSRPFPQNFRSGSCSGAGRFRSRRS
jgi:hypothetical protein